MGAWGNGHNAEMPFSSDRACDLFVRMGRHSNALKLRWTDCRQEFLLLFSLFCRFLPVRKFLFINFFLFNVCLPTKAEGQTPWEQRLGHGVRRSVSSLKEHRASSRSVACGGYLLSE